VAQASTVIILGDGAAWVWENCPNVLSPSGANPGLLSRQPTCGALAKAVYADAGTANNWAISLQSLLYDSELDTLLAEVHALTGATPSEPLKGTGLLGAQPDPHGLPQVSTGRLVHRLRVVEAGCKR